MRDTSKEIGRFYTEMVSLPSPERTEMRNRRNANRERLAKGLGDSKKPLPFTQISQGSYAMRTMIQQAENDYDIDDGAYFRADQLVGPQGGKMSALSVRQMVCDALQDDRFKRQPETRKNCVRVYYEQGYHVDVPCYRVTTVRDNWSGQAKEVVELASAEWKRSDPTEVTAWFKRQNEALSGDFHTSDGQFARVVKLLKAFARSRASWKEGIATGFMITKLTSDVFQYVNNRDDLALMGTMERIVAQPNASLTIMHPTLIAEREPITRLDDPRPGFLRDRLQESLEKLKALQNWDCTHQEAMKVWDDVFCTEWFSGQPEPDKGSGGPGSTGPKGPSSPVVKQGGGRYGRGTQV